ncbi:hypothetical protein O181_010664 [Austropuccinia psidii MF-1]|uniref:Ribosomal protein bL31m N-terminal domain-containing protein n=1 Tax=Austropuccinia psidii MF-1 TaxID=1389203 RepID=A0A9Q3GL32_9BASI|nr:hypothetical protein [Austropuccinia psidii MF-1]
MRAVARPESELSRRLFGRILRKMRKVLGNSKPTTMASFGVRFRRRLPCLNEFSTTVRRQQSSSSNSSSSPSAIINPTAPLFNRREKRKLRIAYPRPDKQSRSLYPCLPAAFVNRVTLSDGSSIYLTTASPKSSISLVRDVTNHPLWNPSLAREVADEDQSGRMGRFARRYAGLKTMDSTSANESTQATPTSSSTEMERQRESNKNLFQQQGFGTEDLDWISGESNQSFYGIGSAKNIKGMKKSGSSSKKS